MIQEKIAELFATIGFRIDAKGLKGFEKRLESIEKQIKSMTGTQIASTNKATKAIDKQADSAAKVNKELKQQAKLAKEAARVNEFQMRLKVKYEKQMAAMQAKSVKEAARVHDFQMGLKQKFGQAKVKPVADAFSTTRKIQLEEGRRLLNARRQQIFNQAEERHKLSMLNLQQRINAAEERARRMRRQQGLFQGNPNQYAGGLGGALVSTAAGGMGLSYLNQANQDIVSKRIAVQAGAGGGEAGVQAWSWLKSEGQRLAFDYRDMAQEYTNLMASFQAGGQSNTVAQQVFRGIMEKSTMLKIAPERRKLIMRAVGQISNKDQLYSEELVGQ